MHSRVFWKIKLICMMELVATQITLITWFHSWTYRIAAFTVTHCTVWNYLILYVYKMRFPVSVVAQSRLHPSFLLFHHVQWSILRLSLLAPPSTLTTAGTYLGNHVNRYCNISYAVYYTSPMLMQLLTLH